MKILGVNYSNQTRVGKIMRANNLLSASLASNSIKMNMLSKDSVNFTGAESEVINLAKKTILNLPENLNGMRVLVRVDHNVTFDSAGKIIDDTRIKATVATISELIKRNAKIVIATHIGDPFKISKGKMGQKISTEPCAQRLGELLEINLGKKVNIIHTNSIVGPKTVEKSKSLNPGEILYLQNLRKIPSETGSNAVKNAEGIYEKVKVSKNMVEAFAKDLAKLGDIYVNDAFGAAHRDHASTSLVAGYIKGPKVAGLLMGKEIEQLGRLLNNPERPFAAVVGGSKISSKTATIQSLLNKVDRLIVGGGMTYTFKAAMGGKIGKSICEPDQIDTAKQIISLARKKGVQLVFAEDVVVTDDFVNSANTKIVNSMNIPDGWEGMDIGPKSIAKFKGALSDANTILWNGPVGVYEKDKFAKGTNAIAQIVAEVTENNKALSVLGGGDTIGAINQSGIAHDSYSHISTGGGASLEFFERNGDMPGIRTLDNLV